MPDFAVKPPVVNIWANGAGAPDSSPPAPSFVEAGWPLSSTPPARQYFNWLLNFLSNGVRYFARRGFTDYDPNETYNLGDAVRSDDGALRQSSVNGNINNTPSASPNFWVPVTGMTPQLGDRSQSLATTEFVGRAQSYNEFVWGLVPAGPIYYKIATLPVSTVGSADSIRISATLNVGYAASGSTLVDIVMGNRAGFSYFWSNYGPNTSHCAVQAYQNPDGTTDVFVVADANFCYANVTISNIGSTGVASSGGAVGPAPTIYAAPFAPSAPAVGSTNVFATNTGTFPPLLNANNQNTYLNAANIAATYATIAALNADVTFLEGYANTAATNAVATSEAFTSAALAAAIALANGSTAATQAVGDATTKVATDSFVQSAIQNAVGASIVALCAGTSGIGSGATGIIFNTALPAGTWAVEADLQVATHNVGQLASAVSVTGGSGSVTAIGSGYCNCVSVTDALTAHYGNAAAMSGQGMGNNVNNHVVLRGTFSIPGTVTSVGFNVSVSLGTVDIAAGSFVKFTRLA